MVGRAWAGLTAFGLLAAALSLDTTCSIPRFNNSGTQNIIFLIQNLSGAACVVNVHSFGPSGTGIGSSGKAMALEPSTGFTFERAMVARPR